MSVNSVVNVADVSAWLFVTEIVSRAVPPALMVLREKVFEIVGLDGETTSVSAAVHVPLTQEGAELVLVTLTGGEMTAVLVTCVCA